MPTPHKPITPYKKYTPEVIDVLPELMIENLEPLEKLVQRDPRLPSAAVLRKWLIQHPDFAEAYDLAKEAQMEMLADQILEIADNETGDQDRDKLKIQTRQWLMSRLSRKRYGEKQQVEIEAGTNLAELLAQRIERAREIRNRGNGIIIDAQTDEKDVD